ncbi:hypothetical protein ACFYYN_39375 [Streptomyces sp. NPDC001902]
MSPFLTGQALAARKKIYRPDPPRRRSPQTDHDSMRVLVVGGTLGVDKTAAGWANGGHLFNPRDHDGRCRIVVHRPQVLPGVNAVSKYQVASGPAAEPGSQTAGQPGPAWGQAERF